MLKYQKFIFEIEFEREVFFSIYPTFLFRSLLGKELRNISCLFKERKCENCDQRYQCAYSKLFETPIPKDNDFLVGRNFAPHPLILFSDAIHKDKNKKTNLEITLIGEAVNYLPYVYYAFQKAGELGIEKDRIKYQIKSVMINKSLNILESNKINTDFEMKSWNFKSTISKEKLKKIINFKTPLRLKVDGKFSSDFGYNDITKSALRRVKVLEEMYGSLSEINEKKFLEKNENKNLHWLDLNHYSSRQKKGMKLGGVVGSLILEGEFSDFEISLLEFIDLFNIGKNISFGLGKIEVF